MNLFRTSRAATRMAAFWAVLALAVHGMAPFAMAPQAAASAPAEGSLEAALKVICTAKGAVTLDDQQDPGTAPSAEHCPLCPVYNASALAPDAPVYGVPFHPESKTVFAVPETGHVVERSESEAQPRAPPVRLI